MSSWSCPHDLDGVCQRVSGAVCDPGMRGCVLEGRVVFANREGEPPRKPRKAPGEKSQAAVTAPKRRLPF